MKLAYLPLIMATACGGTVESETLEAGCSAKAKEIAEHLKHASSDNAVHVFLEAVRTLSFSSHCDDDIGHLASANEMISDIEGTCLSEDTSELLKQRAEEVKKNIAALGCLGEGIPTHSN